ncbi:unnamed protein product [Trifolium pratense]|uniref:Uncharacterized protein n=1 Tax=Trifolium pratense TaxID=57577 RepID=A0ACB0KZQ3_TRIPR|nr:unnamed protein product [Trifolium pratense]
MMPEEMAHKAQEGSEIYRAAILLVAHMKEDLPAGEKFRRGGGVPAERILVAVTRRCLVTAATISHSFLRLHGRIRLLQNSIFLQASQIWWWQAEEGSQATAKQTAELLRSVISQQRVPQTNQATTLINAVRAVGEKLIAAIPVELAVGNIARRVLHIIREEDLSLATAAIAGLELSAVSDDEDDVE